MIALRKLPAHLGRRVIRVETRPAATIIAPPTLELTRCFAGAAIPRYCPGIDKASAGFTVGVPHWSSRHYTRPLAGRAMRLGGTDEPAVIIPPHLGVFNLEDGIFMPPRLSPARSFATLHYRHKGKVQIYVEFYIVRSQPPSRAQDYNLGNLVVAKEIVVRHSRYLI